MSLALEFGLRASNQRWASIFTGAPYKNYNIRIGLRNILLRKDYEDNLGFLSGLGVDFSRYIHLFRMVKLAPDKTAEYDQYIFYNSFALDYKLPFFDDGVDEFYFSLHFGYVLNIVRNKHINGEFSISTPATIPAPQGVTQFDRIVTNELNVLDNNPFGQLRLGFEAEILFISTRVNIMLPLANLRNRLNKEVESLFNSVFLEIPDKVKFAIFEFYFGINLGFD